jgi:hypothetical protein
MQAKYDKNVETGKKKPVLKKGEIDPTYLTLSPLKDFQLKKAIFPTISSNLTELYLQHGSRKNEGSPESPLISTPRGEMYFLRNGDWMQRLDIMKDIGPKNINFLIVGYVIDCKEFTYSENTKKALKVVIDCDGHIIEKVMWPDYDTGKLGAPKDIKKGSVCLFLMQKRAAKKAMYGKPAKESSPSSIVEIIVESV